MTSGIESGELTNAVRTLRGEYVPGQPGLDDVCSLLANERRRNAIECLNSHSGSLPVSDLADEVAAREADQLPPPSDKRHSVYTSLAQVHLPKLDEFGVVEYDTDTQEVTLDEHGIDLTVEVVSEHGLSWAEYYLSLGTVGLLTVGLSVLGFPFVAAVDPMVLVLGYFGLLVASAVYHLRARNVQVLDRVRL